MVTISRFQLLDVLSFNKIKFNVNNIWNINGRPADYDYKRDLCNTGTWIDKFHQNVPMLTISGYDLKWMKLAFHIGRLTGRFPKSYSEELDETCDKLQMPGSSPYFIRTEHVSLKCGMHGVGPYRNIKSIIESLVTATTGHACIDESDTECRIYFMNWIQNFDESREFRVFVHQNKITAVSSQHLYTVNHWMNSLSEAEITELVNKMVKYFEVNIKDKLTYLGSYTMDIYYCGDDKFYFIEPNCFGAGYCAGSSLFHWVTDHDQLHGLTSNIEVRYVSV